MSWVGVFLIILVAISWVTIPDGSRMCQKIWFVVFLPLLIPAAWLISLGRW